MANSSTSAAIGAALSQVGLGVNEMYSRNRQAQLDAQNKASMDLANQLAQQQVEHNKLTLGDYASTKAANDAATIAKIMGPSASLNDPNYLALMHTAGTDLPTKQIPLESQPLSAGASQSIMPQGPPNTRESMAAQMNVMPQTGAVISPEAQMEMSAKALQQAQNVEALKALNWSANIGKTQGQVVPVGGASAPPVTPVGLGGASGTPIQKTSLTDPTIPLLNEVNRNVPEVRRAVELSDPQHRSFDMQFPKSAETVRNEDALKVTATENAKKTADAAFNPLDARNRQSMAAMQDVKGLAQKAMADLKSQHPEWTYDPNGDVIAGQWDPATLLSTMKNAGMQANYKITGVGRPNGLSQMVGLAEPIGAAPFMGNMRNVKMLQLALQHLPDNANSDPGIYNKMNGVLKLYPDLEKNLLEAVGAHGVSAMGGPSAVPAIPPLGPNVPTTQVASAQPTGMIGTAPNPHEAEIQAFMAAHPKYKNRYADVAALFGAVK